MNEWNSCVDGMETHVKWIFEWIRRTHGCQSKRKFTIWFIQSRLETHLIRIVVVAKRASSCFNRSMLNFSKSNNYDSFIGAIVFHSDDMCAKHVLKAVYRLNAKCTFKIKQNAISFTLTCIHLIIISPLISFGPLRTLAQFNDLRKVFEF